MAILREFFSIGTLYIDIMKCRFDWRLTTSIQFDTEQQKLSCAADVILAFEILTRTVNMRHHLPSGPSGLLYCSDVPM